MKLVLALSLFVFAAALAHTVVPEMRNGKLDITIERVSENTPHEVSLTNFDLKTKVNVPLDDQKFCDEVAAFTKHGDTLALNAPLSFKDLFLCTLPEDTQTKSTSRTNVGYVGETVMHFSFTGNDFLTACSSRNDPALLAWSNLLVTNQGSVALFSVFVTGQSISNEIAARHNRFGVIAFKRSGKSNDFYATVVLGDRPALQAGDNLFIVAHTPITCNTIAIPQESDDSAPKALTAKPLPQKRSDESAVKAEPQFETISLSSNQCLTLERTEKEAAMTVSFNYVKVCYKLGDAKACRDMDTGSYVRKTVFYDKGSNRKTLSPEQSLDLCILSVVPDMNKLIAEKPLIPKPKQARSSKLAPVAAKVATYESPEYRDAKFAIAVHTAFINVDVDLHPNSGVHPQELEFPFSVIDGVLNLEQKETVSKRGDNWHDGNNNNSYYVEETGFPLWLIIVLVCVFVGAVVLIFFFFIYTSSWYSPPAARYVAVAQTRSY